MNIAVLSPLFPDVAMWKKDWNFQYIDANKPAIMTFGYKQLSDIIGQRDEDHPCKIAESADIFHYEDNAVMTTQKTRKYIEIMCCASDEWKIFLVTKNPDIKNGVVQGTFASCVDITHVISKLQFMISKKQNNTSMLQKSYLLDSEYDNFKLPRKQSACLFYLLRGKTAKEIAAIMKISRRTAESHIEQLKIKFNVNKKSDLIEKALSKGLGNILPEFLIQQQDSIIL